MEVNNYASQVHNNTRTDNTRADKTSKKDESVLGMDDFLKLLAAQLANQDMMNPSSDTEFIAQMAQFSSLQAMDSLAKMTSFNQSTALIGKNVVVATYDKGGKLVTEEGIVTKVNLFGSEPTIVVNGKEYLYSNVMEIRDPSYVEPEPEPDPDPDKPVHLPSEPDKPEHLPSSVTNDI